MPKLRMSKRNKSMMLIVIMLFLTVASAVLSRNDNQPPAPEKPKIEYLGNWKGMSVYGQKTAANTSIYYLELQPGYSIVMRADPREAEKVESPPSMLIYSLLYMSPRVYAVFNPDESGNVSLAYAELAKFLANRPFEVVFATTKPYTDEINRTYPHMDPFNTTQEEAVVFLKLSNETKIELINRTVVVEGNNLWNLTRASAKLELMIMRLI